MTVCVSHFTRVLKSYANTVTITCVLHTSTNDKFKLFKNFKLLYIASVLLLSIDMSL